MRIAAIALLGLAAAPLAAAQGPDAIRLTDLQKTRLGVTEEPARQADGVAMLDVVGRVIRAPSGVRPVAAPFAGLVMRVHATAGAVLKAGDPIVTLQSRDYAAAHSSLQQAQTELRTAGAALDRQKQLLANGLVSRASVEEAESRAARARAMLQEASAVSASATATGEGGGYVVRAPSAGRIGAIQVRAGDNVAAMQLIGSVAVSQDMWIEFQAPARIAGQLHAGDAVKLPSGDSATIISVSDVLDPATRSSVAVAAAPAGLRIYEGQFLRGRLTQAAAISDELVQIPSRAVIQINGKDHVFRRTADGYSPTPVGVVGRTAEAATISGGLRPGDQVAASGLTELKSLALQGTK